MTDDRSAGTSQRTKPRTAAQVALLGRPQYFSFVMATSRWLRAGR